MCLACVALRHALPSSVIPAKAGTHGAVAARSDPVWAPAFAGVTNDRTGATRNARSILARIPGFIGIGLIKAYRYTLSPLIGGQCRYLPTCSAYAEEAIGKYGLWAGGWMFVARFQRCGPNGASGYDPVPETLKPRARWYLPWRYGFWTGAHMDPATRLDLRD